MKKSLTALVLGGALSLGLASLPAVYSSSSSEFQEKQKITSIQTTSYLVPEAPVVSLLAVGVMAALYRKRR